jgi:hypothetical protein
LVFLVLGVRPSGKFKVQPIQLEEYYRKPYLFFISGQVDIQSSIHGSGDFLLTWNLDDAEYSSGVELRFQQGA